MPAKSRAGIESLETKGLGFRSIDYFPDVDAQFLEQDFQLVDHGNVHATVGVLENFARFSDFTAGDRHDLNHGVRVECRRQFEAFLSITTDHFGNAVSTEVRIAGIFSFGAVGEEEVFFNF